MSCDAQPLQTACVFAIIRYVRHNHPAVGQGIIGVLALLLAHARSRPVSDTDLISAIGRRSSQQPIQHQLDVRHRSNVAYAIARLERETNTYAPPRPFNAADEASKALVAAVEIDVLWKRRNVLYSRDGRRDGRHDDRGNRGRAQLAVTNKSSLAATTAGTRGPTPLTDANRSCRQ